MSDCGELESKIESALTPEEELQAEKIVLLIRLIDKSIELIDAHEEIRKLKQQILKERS